MAAPEFVPTKANQTNRSYSSPPRRDGSWMADRPGELGGRQPGGEQLGSQGPDQGYVLSLARRFAGTLALSAGEHESDALAGACAVAMKRASSYGRAPVIFDLQAALAIWGLLDPSADAELVTLRTSMFEEAHSPHHYPKLRAIADATSVEVLHRPHPEIVADAVRDWRSCISVD